MKKGKNDKPGARDDLRRQAEEHLGETKAGAISPPAREDAERLVHELQVHQIELEIQNEELQVSREATETALEKYADLYALAPVGYFTLNCEGVVQEANLMAANLLGVERSCLIQRRFGAFLSQESLPPFNDFLHALNTARAPLTCEVTSQKIDSQLRLAMLQHRHLRLDGIPVEFTEGKSHLFRVTMTDITERKQAEEALKRARDELETIFDAAPSLIFYKDKENRLIRVNKAYSQSIGLPKEEIERRPASELYPEMAEAYWRDDLEVMASGQPKLNIVEMLHSPASKRWGRTDKIPYRNEQGEIVGVIGFVEDITDRKLAEEALQRYEVLARNSRDIILFVRREDGRFIEANDAAIKAYGYDSAELLSLGIRDVRLPEDARLVEQQMAEADSSGILFETIHRRKDGSTFPVEVSSRGITIGGQRVLLSIVRDITERKATEDALRFLLECDSMHSGEDFFQALARHLARSLGMDFVCIDRLQQDLLAAETEAVYFDGKFEDNISYTLKDTPCGEVVDKTVCCFPSDVRHLFPNDAILQEMAAESYVGTILWGSQRQPIGLIAVIGRKPLTNPKLVTSILQLVAVRAASELERRQSQEALRRLADDLARSNQDLAQFASVASHDLQEPLRQIEGFIKLIGRKYRGKLDDEATEFIDYVVDGATRMEQLIQDLLAWSLVGRPDSELRSLDAQEALDRALSNLGASIHESGALIIHDPMPTVYANSSQLAQVFQNLISNAIKFRKDKQPEIHVGVRREDNCWSFSVHDNGIGFAPEYAKDVFQIFKRLHLREEYAGTGIGLAICQKVIERHGGQIRAESEPGQGATFYFTIPVAE